MSFSNFLFIREGGSRIQFQLICEKIIIHFLVNSTFDKSKNNFMNSELQIRSLKMELAHFKSLNSKEYNIITTLWTIINHISRYSQLSFAFCPKLLKTYSLRPIKVETKLLGTEIKNLY